MLGLGANTGKPDNPMQQNPEGFCFIRYKEAFLSDKTVPFIRTVFFLKGNAMLFKSKFEASMFSIISRIKYKVSQRRNSKV